MAFSPNALFVCDALTVLERLPADTVELAYLDPPWGMRFTNKLSTDGSEEDQEEAYVQYLSRVVQQVKRVLTDTGSLFVHWSQVSPIDIRLVMNQAFVGQPRYEITWTPKSVSNIQYRHPRPDNEFLLVYARSETPTYNKVYRPLTPSEEAQYSKRDERDRYYETPLTVRVVRPNRQRSWRGYEPGPEESWSRGYDELDQLAAENRIAFPTDGGMPRLKHYLGENPGVEVGMTWQDIPALALGRKRTGFVSQRPLPLMQRIIHIASNAGDLVLDPFFGSGTTLVAAHSLGRKWWGCDELLQAHEITRESLLSDYGLRPEVDYKVYSERDVLQRLAVDTTYSAILSRTDKIADLQAAVANITDQVLSLKRRLNIGEDASEERVEDAVAEIEKWVGELITGQSTAAASYAGLVRAWAVGYSKLHANSRAFLEQAEFLFAAINHAMGDDYSPFILQYCKALENELLAKLFATYTDDVHTRFTDVRAFLNVDLRPGETKKFAQAVKDAKKTYTLGEMAVVMRLVDDSQPIFHQSPLLQDFRHYCLTYFNVNIVERAYLDQINRINTDFRRKAAHPYVLIGQDAVQCREQLRACLNDFILNYKGPAAGTA